MEKQPFISVIVPVFNGGKCLEQCLDALLPSLYPFCEVIVVDDGSTDNSVEISRQRGASVYHMTRQSGPAAARNHGASKARGDVLLFVDADVVVRSDTLARIAMNFEKNPRLAVG